MPDALHTVAALCLGVLTGARTSMLRGTVTARCLWVALALLGLCQALQVQPVYRTLEDLTGLPGSAALTIHALTVLAAVATRALHDSLDPGRPAGLDRRPVLLAAGALLVMGTAYGLAPPTEVPTALAHRSEYYDATAGTAVVWTAYLLYLNWSLAGMFAATRRFAGQAQPGPTRTGLRLGAAGIAVGFGYVALKVVVVAGWLAGHGPALVQPDAIGEALVLTCCLLLIATGSAYEALNSRVAGLPRALTRRRSLRQLRRLARVLAQSSPGAQYRLPAQDDHQRLILRVTDIRDAQRSLRAHTEPGVRQRAHDAALAAGTAGQDAEDLADAATLELARRAKARGQRPYPSTVAEPTGGWDLDSEIHCLQRLAVAYGHPFVRGYADAHDTPALAPATTHERLYRPSRTGFEGQH